MKIKPLDFVVGFMGIILTIFFLLFFDNSPMSFLGLYLGGVSFGYFCRILDEIIAYNLKRKDE